MNFCKWFETFLLEKSLPAANWELTAPDGDVHWIGSDVVIEAIRGASAGEQRGIKATLVKIDFGNGDVNHFFRHLAQALVDNF